MRVVFCVATFAAASAAADPCKTDAPVVRTIAGEIEKLSTDADDAALACGFHGADEKRLLPLAADMKRYSKVLHSATGPQHGTCQVSPTGLTAAGLATQIASWSDAAVVQAVVLCSPKIRARVAELKKAGKPAADLAKEMNDQTAAWIRAAVAP
jgi:hypothetical protein